mmetsp:Transcript_19841/g.34145  ORF Transcript_19841/g.34145 Transcript_19841/m.34145 type:complete len:116 (-) Transcript_19841:1389-1736(-)
MDGLRQQPPGNLQAGQSQGSNIVSAQQLSNLGLPFRSNVPLGQPQAPPAQAFHLPDLSKVQQQPPSSSGSGQLQQQHLQQLQQFWQDQIREIEQVDDFKNHQLPLARIKKNYEVR